MTSRDAPIEEGSVGHRGMAVLSAVLLMMTGLAGCLMSTTVETMPRADEYHVNGLEYQTQHLKLEGEEYKHHEDLIVYPWTISVGVDFWIGGLNVDYGYEDAGDQAPADERPLVTELPATYDVLDGVMTGDMNATEYADWLVPRFMDRLEDHPRSELVKRNAIETYNERLREMDEDRRQEVLERFEEHTSIEMTESYLDESTFQTYKEHITRQAVEDEVYPRLKDQLDSLAGMTPEGFTFSEGAIHTETFLKALKIMNHVRKNGDAEDVERVQSYLAPLFDEGDSGTTTADEVNQAFEGILELQKDGEVAGDLQLRSMGGIGIAWADWYFHHSETHRLYYKQVTFPLPIDAPGVPLERQTINFVTGEEDGGDYHETDLRLDPIALPVTLPFLQSPLAAGAASDKEMTVSNVVLNLGFEPGRADVTFEAPDGWAGLPSTRSVTLDAFEYQVVSAGTEVPERDTVDTEVFSTHVASYDVDENEHKIDNGGFGDTALNNDNQVLQDFLDDASLLFNTQRQIATGPLDVILLEEPNAGDGAQLASDTYDAANTAREAAPGGDAEDDTPAEPVADDPEEGSEATVNDLLGEIVPQLRSLREDARDQAEEETGEDPVALVEGTPLVTADVDQEIEDAEDRRLGVAAPDLNTWDERVYQDGTAVTTVSNGEELAGELEDRLERLQEAEDLEAFVSAMPSLVAVPNDVAGFGGATVPFETGDGTQQVPVEVVIDVLVELGVGLVQDGDGYATMPLIHSPADKVLAGSSDSDEIRLSGEAGSFRSAPVFAVPDEGATPRATFDQDVSGAAHSPDLAAGTAEVAGGAGSGADAFVDGTQSLVADSTSQSLADTVVQADETAQGSAAATQNSVLANVAWQYRYEIAQADETADELENSPFAAEAHADNGIALADEATGASAKVVEAGDPAIGSKTVGVSSGFNAQDLRITSYSHGEATVFGPDVQSSPSDYTGAFAEASSDAGFAVGLDIGGNLVDYPSTFGE